MKGRRKEKAAERRAQSFLSLETPWDYAKLFLALILLILLAMIAFVLWPAGREVRTSVSTEPLRPNAALNLSPGERFAYNFSFGRESALAEFSVESAFENCLVVKTTPADGEGCLAANGSLLWGNLSGGFFEEWMLALAPNWSWRVRVRNEIAGLGLAEERVVTYAVSEVADRKGRRAFHILVSSSPAAANASVQEAEVWVDAEKRILLEMNARGLRTELVSAPFPLA
ncbi:MAG: hypothetical protein QXH27_00630 [Candidatus Micrarchaeia archaeon]